MLNSMGVTKVFLVMAGVLCLLASRGGGRRASAGAQGRVRQASAYLLVFVALAFFDERDLRQHAHQRDRLLLLLLVKRLADRHARRQQVLDHLLAVVLAVAVHRVVFGGLILHVVEP
eukprot:2129665-Prymnesium_polylepis.1